MNEPETVLTSSFHRLIATVAPEVMPVLRAGGDTLTPQATTIVAACYDAGVVMAGDRRATMGHLIAQREIEKVFCVDEYSIVGIAGAAGMAMELVRLFQVELEHYEKIEGVALSLDGKANRLGALVRANLDLALNGFVAIPLFAGWDPARKCGRIVSYDATGGRYEESGFYAVGSGAAFARGSLKKTLKPQASEEEAIISAIRSLYDAADEDSATGGPDLARSIFPVVMTATSKGVRLLASDEVGELTTRVLEES